MERGLLIRHNIIITNFLCTDALGELNGSTSKFFVQLTAVLSATLDADGAWAANVCTV